MRELDRIVILLVEDDDDARELMDTALAQRGALVHVAESVDAALRVLESVTPDIIVSDIAMPDVDGLAFIQRLRGRGVTTPAVAVSAFVTASDRARALNAGFDRYLHKPIDFDQLVQTVQALLRPAS